MKRIILKIAVLSALVVTTSLSAASFTYKTNSLVGIEGSYSSFDVENDATPPVREKIDFSGVGLKIGAETDNYRLFLSLRNSFISGNYDYAYFYGGEVQYLMNFSSFANFFIGLNGGYSNLRFVDSLNESRDVDSTYLGGDLGFNIHLGPSVDIELGGRILKLSDATSSATTATGSLNYDLDYIATGYASIIFKYSMD